MNKTEFNRLFKLYQRGELELEFNNGFYYFKFKRGNNVFNTTFNQSYKLITSIKWTISKMLKLINPEKITLNDYFNNLNTKG